MNIESPMNILNSHVRGSFHFFIIHQQKTSAIMPTSVTERPLNIGLVFENIRKSICFGSIWGYFITGAVKVKLNVLEELGKLDLFVLLNDLGPYPVQERRFVRRG